MATKVKRESSGRPDVSPALPTQKHYSAGPVMTARATKEAMLFDIGPLQPDFTAILQNIRQELVVLAGGSHDIHTCVPLQGPATYCIEAVLATTVPKHGGKVLVLENGDYGKLQAVICEALDIPVHVESFDRVPVEAQRVEQILRDDPTFTHVAVVHCETSIGLLNPIQEIGEIVKSIDADLLFIVDAVSSFGAVPLDVSQSKIDFLISSANKSFEGIPGWAYCIARTGKLLAAKGNVRSYSLDLIAQYEEMECTGLFRFTPPYQSLLAFQQALNELKKEGGIEARAKRYNECNRLLRLGMATIGFKEYLNPEDSGYLVTRFLYPRSPRFTYDEFCRRLSEQGCSIIPNKRGECASFRIGNIGQLFPIDMQNLVTTIRRVLEEMGIPMPLD